MAFILVVDDDDIVGEHAAHVLINAGHACGWVNSAEAALALLARKRPDLIVLDQNLPGENGTMLLRKIRHSPRLFDVPVIMLTGVQGTREEQIAYYTGAQDYIRKPYTEKMLVSRTQEALYAYAERKHRTPEEKLRNRNGETQDHGEQVLRSV